MRGRLQIAWQRRWPLAAAALGLALLLPELGGNTLARGIDAAVLTGLAGMGRWFPGAAVARREPRGDPGHDAELRVRFEQSGHPVLPPARWNVGGTFEAVLLGPDRSDERLSLLQQTALARQPVVLARDEEVVLLGFTRRTRAGALEVRPLSARGVVISAVARTSSGREVRFRATGAGRRELAVDGPDARSELQAGDPVWVDPGWASRGWESAWTPPAGFPLRLGEVVLDPDELDWTRRHRVRLAFDADQLSQVAVFRPSDGRPPTTARYRSCRAAPLALPEPGLAHEVVLDVGWEAGVRPGQAVVDGSWLIGRVESVGWKACRVRSTRAPGTRIHALVFGEGSASPGSFRVSADGQLELDDIGADGVVATGFGDPLVPPSLRLCEFSGGVERAVPDGWPTSVSIWIPAGETEAGPAIVERDDP